MNPARLVAHRGQCRQYPENTLLAFQKAVDAGARHIEVDIHFTKDNIPVVAHDPMLNRISGVPHHVHELTLEELKRYHAYEPDRLGDTYISEPIPSLRDLIDWANQHASHVHWFVEIKPEVLCIREVNDVFHRINNMTQRLHGNATHISYDMPYLNAVRDQHGVSYGLIVTEWPQVITDLPELTPQYVFINKKKIPDSADLLEIDAKVVVYDCVEREEAQYWLERGASHVESFDIAHLLQTEPCKTTTSSL